MGMEHDLVMRLDPSAEIDMTKAYHPETLALHGGQTPDPVTRSLAVPIHRTSSYVFTSTEQAANLFALKELGNVYTRMGSPTQDVLEQRISLLEDGAASLAVASGTSAIFYAFLNLAQAGDEIVAANNLYGGTITMLDAILPQLGITGRLVDPKDPENFQKAITPRTRAIFIEAIGNPLLDLVDIERIAEVAHRNGLPLIVDATFSTPCLLQSIHHGADIVVNSLTKWIGGHGTAIGGSITDSGKFDWKSGRHPLFSEADPNYHGMRWAFDLPAELAPIAFILRARTVPLRNLGAAIAPDNAWIFLQGLETLPLRMARHCENALAVAQHLERHPKVAWVRYPGLPGDPSHALARKYLKGGFGGMVVFGIKGGAPAGVKLIDHITLFSHLANVGDAKSLIIHPASTTHSQLSEQQQLEGGITPDLIRLSIGIEHIDDIIDALDTGLAQA